MVMNETLTYTPRKAIKSQGLVDFVAEWTDSQLPWLKFRQSCG